MPDFHVRSFLARAKETKQISDDQTYLIELLNKMEDADEIELNEDEVQSVDELASQCDGLSTLMQGGRTIITEDNIITRDHIILLIRMIGVKNSIAKTGPCVRNLRNHAAMVDMM
jgi:hypothetical protein